MPPGKTNQPYLDGLHAAARACTGEEHPDMWEYRGARHLAGKCEPGGEGRDGVAYLSTTLFAFLIKTGEHNEQIRRCN